MAEARIARVLGMDPAVVVTETNDLLRAARTAAAHVYQDDDQRERQKSESQMAQARSKR